MSEVNQQNENCGEPKPLLQSDDQSVLVATLSKKKEKKLIRKNNPITAETRFAGSKRGDAEANGPSKQFVGVSQRDEKRLYTTFDSRKKLWLSEIAKHSAPINPKETPEEADKSNKGFIDQRCLPIMSLLNAHADYVTTSSCSGRICLFHSVGGDGDEEDTTEVEAADDNNNNNNNNNNNGVGVASKMKRGAEGSLGWILASHDSPLSEDQIQLVLRHTVPNHVSPTSILSSTSVNNNNNNNNNSTAVATVVEASASPSATGGIPSRGAISFKCEPFLLHVQCRTIEAAKRLLNAASDAGFRNSGMIPPGKNIMVGIRHASLSIDAPIVTDGVSFASEPYIRYLVKVSEEKMAENFRRTELLEQHIRRWLTVGGDGEERIVQAH